MVAPQLELRLPVSGQKGDDVSAHPSRESTTHHRAPVQFGTGGLQLLDGLSRRSLKRGEGVGASRSVPPGFARHARWECDRCAQTALDDDDAHLELDVPVPLKGLALQAVDLEQVARRVVFEQSHVERAPALVQCLTRSIGEGQVHVSVAAPCNVHPERWYLPWGDRGRGSGRCSEVLKVFE